MSVDFLLKFDCKGGYTLEVRPKPRLYEAASTRLVWTTYVYCALSTNRIKPNLLPPFDVPTTDGSICAMHDVIAFGRCTVHTTRAEAASVLSRLKCVSALRSSLQSWFIIADYCISSFERHMRTYSLLEPP